MVVPSTLTLGPLTLHLYGLILGVGVLAALHVVGQIAKQEQVLSEKKFHLLVWIAIGSGVVGARVYHVIDEWHYYAQNLTLIPQVWRGGLGIYGGMIGGVLALMLGAILVQTKTHPKEPGRIMRSAASILAGWFDVAALGLPLGQAIGRLGNWVNQELYGLPTTLPWGIYIAPENRIPGFERYSHFHPLFAYEAAWMLATFVFLYGFTYRQKKIDLGTGVYALAYLVSYAVIRFSLDFLRLDPWRLGSLTTSQWISLVLVAISLIQLMRVKQNVIR